MSIIKSERLAQLVLFISLLAGIVLLFPWLFKHIVVWQREFNQLISTALHQIKQTPTQAGATLILVSFLYGVFHALGPGHGKFVIASYLSTHQSKLKTSMRLTFLSSLMQGVVAITATSIIVVVLHLSSSYFRASQLWLERAAFILMMLLASQWIYQAITGLIQSKKKPTLRIRSISQVTPMTPSAVKKTDVFHQHQAGCACGCGHQHLPDEKQLQAQSWKSQLLVILSIGMRPCTGAIFVLFLAFMLDLYPWGIAAAMAMALGTGLMLSGFAIMVQYARQSAVKLGAWYGGKLSTYNTNAIIKLSAGLILMIFAASLLFATTLPSSGGAILFAR